MLLFGIFAFGWAMNAVSTVRYTLARELLKRLGQRRRDVALGWEDADPSTVAVSAFQADVLRCAFRALVGETGTPECQWRDLAKALVRDFTGCELIETGLVDWIVSK
nr:hypothetical protein [Mesorhizobium sp. LSJC265A00]